RRSPSTPLSIGAGRRSHGGRRPGGVTTGRATGTSGEVFAPTNPAELLDHHGGRDQQGPAERAPDNGTPYKGQQRLRTGSLGGLTDDASSGVRHFQKLAAVVRKVAKPRWCKRPFTS